MTTDNPPPPPFAPIKGHVGRLSVARSILLIWLPFVLLVFWSKTKWNQMRWSSRKLNQEMHYLSVWRVSEPADNIESSSPGVLVLRSCPESVKEMKNVSVCVVKPYSNFSIFRFPFLHVSSCKYVAVTAITRWVLRHHTDGWLQTYRQRLAECESKESWTSQLIGCLFSSNTSVKPQSYEAPCQRNHTSNVTVNPPRITGNQHSNLCNRKWCHWCPRCVRCFREPAQLDSKSVTMATYSMKLTCWLAGSSSTDPEFLLLLSWSLQPEGGGRRGVSQLTWKQKSVRRGLLDRD